MQNGSIQNRTEQQKTKWNKRAKPIETKQTQVKSNKTEQSEENLSKTKQTKPKQNGAKQRHNGANGSYIEPNTTKLSKP